MRGFMRCGGVVSVFNRVAFDMEDTYMKFNSDEGGIETYINSKRALSVFEKSSSGGGALHGVWYADNLVHTSDRRLKTSIRPLMDVFNEMAGRKDDKDGAAWVLRELRPVSYHFKTGVESKLQRFGFIADDVAQTMPQVIRETPARYKGIAYQDLIAVLTAVLQSVTQRVEIADSGAQEQRLRLESLEASLSRLEATLDRHAAIMEARLRSIEAAIRRRRGVKGSLRRRRGSGRAATALGASRGDS